MEWSRANNLTLNQAKSVAVIFRDNRKRRFTPSTSPLQGIARVTLLKVLGITLSDRLSVTAHVDDEIGSCARSMYAISVLRSHGMEASALQQVFRAVVVSKLTYLRTLRRGGALRPPSTDSVSMLFYPELFGPTCGHCLGSLTRIPSRTSATQLMMNCLAKSKTSSNHILHALLPPPSIASQNYGLRQRAHSFQLPERSTRLSDCNLLMRMLYKNSY